MYKQHEVIKMMFNNRKTQVFCCAVLIFMIEMVTESKKEWKFHLFMALKIYSTF